MTQRILITGTSTGFGARAVEELRAAGHEVAATMRAVEGRNREAADKLQELGAKIFEIDVTDTQSVNKGVAAALEALDGLDVLINNAGVGVLGLQEAFTPEDFQRVFDINVFGVQRMNRAVLPHFRSQRRGRLVHISSLLGRMTIPFYGPYNATKWALEAVAENYRTELSGFGIESCLIEPGGYPTAFMDSLIRPSDTNRSEDYGDMAQAPEASLRGFGEMLRNTPAQDPEDVIKAIVASVEAERGKLPFRTVVDAIGMGDAIKPYNDLLAQVTEGIYGHMGMADSLKVKLDR
ncbi:MAG: SDR family oxidoreductase [Myxococcota bacterium]